ncbi:MAG TPA: response regulator transcription factor [Thermoleophilaceae bacterium]|nr:response regulator transcription factor [Thermoleophilaceae bacterium]
MVGQTRVLIADDHPLFRGAIARVVNEDDGLELVGEAVDGQEALEQIRALKPDVAVIDVRMPALDGSDVLTAVRAEGLPTNVVFLSAFLDSKTVYDAVAAGANAYLSKEAETSEIVRAIQAAARGETILGPEVQTGLAEQIRLREESDARPRLSDREHEVLRMIAQGMSAPEIGERIHLSTATVKTHLQHLYEKLGVSERAAAVAEGMRRGLLD